MRAPGDLFFSPETGQKLRVAGVLERSGTSDDSLFFVPLKTAQKMFGQSNRLTAVAVRLRDPALMREATQRLQSIPGAQVVTITEMLGTFLNLVGSVRTLLISVALVAVAISVLSVFNTLLAAVVERTKELAVMRAVGASKVQVFGLIALEALLLTGVGTMCGIVVAIAAGPGIERVVKEFIPMAPVATLIQPTVRILLGAISLGTLVGLLSGLYPAWRAGQLQPAEALKTE